MNPEVNAQDLKGITPLHLAVKSVELIQSTRPVRALLIKGADRDLKDNEGKKALSHVSKNLPKSLQKELKSVLAKPGCLECLMITTPLVPLKPSRKTPYFFWTLQFIYYFSMFCVLFPSKP